MGTTIVSCGAIIIECIIGVVLNVTTSAVEISNSNKVADAQIKTEQDLRAALLAEQNRSAAGYGSALFD